jgi:hypothetical protein
MILSSLSGTDFPDPSPEFLEGQGKGYKVNYPFLFKVLSTLLILREGWVGPPLT